MKKIFTTQETEFLTYKQQYCKENKLYNNELLILPKILFVLTLVALIFILPSNISAYTPNRINPTGNFTKWDLSKTNYSNINAEGKILIKFNQAGCKEHSSFSGPIDEFQAYVNSFSQWNDNSYCKAKLAYDGLTNSRADGNDGKNTIYFDNKGNISPGVYGLTTITYDSNSGEIFDADIALNDKSYIWDTLGRNTTSKSNYVYVEPIVTHELGHLLGLDHSFLENSSLSSKAFTGEISQHFLSRDDFAGASFLYPEPEFLTDFAILNGVATKNSNPVFGAVIVAVNLKNFKPLTSTLSEQNGSFQLNGLDVGNYVLFAHSADKSVLVEYYDSIDEDIAPKILGLSNGQSSNPGALNPIIPTELLIKPNLNPPLNVNIDLDSIASLNPFEPNNSTTDATFLPVDSAAGEPVYLAASIETTVDRDYYKFNVKKDSEYSFIVLAHSLKSPLDAKITLFDAAVSELISPVPGSAVFDPRADDSDPLAYDENGIDLDPKILNWKSPLTGEVYLKIDGYSGSEGFYFLIVREENIIQVPDAATSFFTLNSNSILAGTSAKSQVNIYVRNKFDEPVTNLLDSDVTVHVGVNQFIATQDTNDNSHFSYEIQAANTTGSDEISVYINPLINPIFQKETVYYTTQIDTSNTEVAITPSQLFADGYSQAQISIRLFDTAGNPVFDSSAIVVLDTTQGTLNPITFDNKTGFFNTDVTSPFSTENLEANVGVWVNSIKVGDYKVTFDGKVKIKNISKSGGCSMSSSNSSKSGLIFLSCLVIILLFIFRFIKVSKSAVIMIP